MTKHLKKLPAEAENYTIKLHKWLIRKVFLGKGYKK